MRFSVIIPTLNRASLLQKVLLALNTQSLPASEFEIVVVDNGSTDNTDKIVGEFQKTSRAPVVFYRESRRGLHWARHAGAVTAKGEILAYIDDDAIPEKDWLEELGKAYSHFQADSAGGKINIQWDREPPAWIIPYEPFLGRLDHGSEWRLLSNTEFINGGNFSILRNRLFEIGGFNPDQVNQRLIGDGETGLCLKIHKLGWKMAWVPDAVVRHMQFVDRNGTLQDIKRRFWNNGVCKAYAYYRTFKPGPGTLVIRAIYKTLSSAKQKGAAIISQPGAQSSKEYSPHELSSSYLAGEAQYYWRLAYDDDFRKLALLDNWINLI